MYRTVDIENIYALRLLVPSLVGSYIFITTTSFDGHKYIDIVT